MNGIYRKIERGELPRDQLVFWRDRTETMSGPWASKVHNACILRLDGIVDTTPPPEIDELKSNQVELKWKSRILGNIPEPLTNKAKQTRIRL